MLYEKLFSEAECTMYPFSLYFLCQTVTNGGPHSQYVTMQLVKGISITVPQYDNIKWKFSVLL